ncbi:hypothetical protein [Streptomyces sp. NPDC001985]|uniref:hypothetical protein n=1 Tax=Streptomyces sp. NPDC001985 TaxID=3154406 RepID=UPI0033303E9F
MRDPARQRTHPMEARETDPARPIAVGDLSSIAPEWVPRDGYAEPTREILLHLEAGLKQLAANARTHG